MRAFTANSLEIIHADVQSCRTHPHEAVGDQVMNVWGHWGPGSHDPRTRYFGKNARRGRENVHQERKIRGTIQGGRVICGSEWGGRALLLRFQPQVKHITTPQKH